MYNFLNINKTTIIMRAFYNYRSMCNGSNLL